MLLLGLPFMETLMESEFMCGWNQWIWMSIMMGHESMKDKSLFLSQAWDKDPLAQEIGP